MYTVRHTMPGCTYRTHYNKFIVEFTQGCLEWLVILVGGDCGRCFILIYKYRYINIYIYIVNDICTKIKWARRVCLFRYITLTCICISRVVGTRSVAANAAQFIILIHNNNGGNSGLRRITIESSVIVVIAIVIVIIVVVIIVTIVIIGITARVTFVAATLD